MELFLQKGKWDADAYRDVLAELQRLSLVHIAGTEGNEVAFSFHPLVQDCLQLRIEPLSRQQRFRADTTKMVSDPITGLSDLTARQKHHAISPP